MALSDSFCLLTSCRVPEENLGHLLDEVSIPKAAEVGEQLQILVSSGIWFYSHCIPRGFEGEYKFRSCSFQVQDGLEFDVIRPKNEELYEAYRTGSRKLLSFSSRLIALLNCDTVVLFNTGEIKLIHISGKTFLNSNGVIEEDAHLIEPPYEWFNRAE